MGGNSVSYFRVQSPKFAQAGLGVLASHREWIPLRKSVHVEFAVVRPLLCLIQAYAPNSTA